VTDEERDRDLIGRLMTAAGDEEVSGGTAALVERLFAALPVASQERLLRELLGRLLGRESAPSQPRRGPTPTGGPAERAPFRDIGPWRTCCRMMAAVDQVEDVADLEPAVPAGVFAALGDETRIRIIRLLQDGELRVEDLTRTLDVPQSTLSHHLRVLREAGLVRVDRRGRSNFYSLAQPEESR